MGACADCWGSSCRRGVSPNAAATGAAIAACIRPGTLAVDINASTPAMKRRAGQAVSLYGATAPLSISGSGADAFATLVRPLGFSIEIAGAEPGPAAAVKMLRSVVTKGIEALAVEALTDATAAGVRREALRGICGPWIDRPICGRRAGWLSSGRHHAHF